MKFNAHPNLEGQHAFLSPSKHHWVNYDEEKLVDSYARYNAAQRGTELHQYACDSIRLGIKLPKTHKTLNLYVNDAIGYKMHPEQPLLYSLNSFGTADSISFRNGLLRIHDLKTGTTPASMNQLEIYAALFCLEYHIRPSAIDSELRIYQNDEVVVYNPESEEIAEIMEKIVRFDKIIEKLKAEGA